MCECVRIFGGLQLATRLMPRHASNEGVVTGSSACSVPWVLRILETAQLKNYRGRSHVCCASCAHGIRRQDGWSKDKRELTAYRNWRIAAYETQHIQERGVVAIDFICSFLFIPCIAQCCGVKKQRKINVILYKGD
jgi:hypothetical protein